MAADSIELIIVTPERQLLRETVTEVTLPGADGQLGVLPGHAPLITELGIGELTYRSKGGAQSDPIAIIIGFAGVLGERVTVLAETAERAGEINLERAEKAKKRAEERLAEITVVLMLDQGVPETGYISFSGGFFCYFFSTKKSKRRLQ